MDLFAPTHIILLLLVVLVIFGPSKLGDVGGAMGKGIRDFKRAINEPDSIPVPLIEAAAAATSGTIPDKTS
jgi:sec-independent protein translocase protein TatA